jgi:hypothetical protein
MEITTISTLLTGIKTATDIAKLIKSSDFTLKEAEAKMKLAELISALADIKIHAADVREQISERDELIRLLQKTAAIKKKMQYEAPVYFTVDNENRDGPFCQCCYDTTEKLIRLQLGASDGTWRCASCLKSFYASGSREKISDEYLKALRDRGQSRNR